MFFSLQVYKGLDIATAKATKEEQAAAPHHLLDIAVPGQPFTVVNFRDAALPIVSFFITIIFTNTYERKTPKKN